MNFPQSIFEENAAMSGEQARKLIETMKVPISLPLFGGVWRLTCMSPSQDKGHYHEDIFGVTLKTAEVTTRVRTAAKK